MLNRNDPCYCGSGKKWKKCHYPYAPSKEDPSILAERYLKQYGIILKTPTQIAGIRKACALTAKILDEACRHAKVGVTTDELNTLVHQLCLDAGAEPAPLGYGSPPYPKSICTSFNEVICHGIPDGRRIEEGDILNIDVSCVLGGYYGDSSRMVMIGKVSPERKKVVDIAYACLMHAIAILKPGVLLLEIGNVIDKHARENGCSVVDLFTAHGIGIEFHEPPQIPHNLNNLHIPLAPGMTFTIEPMINAGVKGAIIDRDDHWTARTADGKPSAQWEHTVLITPNGHEILTPWD
jgi:methionyl aminopeptidase